MLKAAPLHSNVLETMEIEALIEATIQNVPHAFDEIVRRYYVLVLRTARRIVTNAEDAHDVAQDVFVSVLKNLAGFRRDSAFSTWLTRIAINTSLMHLRKIQRRACFSLDDTGEGELSPYEYLEARDRSPEEVAIDLEERSLLMDAVQRLPNALRAITVDRLVTDLAIESLADRQGVTTAAAKSRLLRAKNALIATVQRDLRGDRFRGIVVPA